MCADATDTWWPDCCSFSPSVGQTLPQQCWHLSGSVTDRSLSRRTSPLSKAHMDKNSCAQTHTHTHMVLIKEHQPQLVGWLGEVGGTEVGYWEVDYSACVGSNFSNVGICGGLGLIPGATWNLSSLLFNQHSCHFHTSRSHCANSKRSSQPRASEKVCSPAVAGLKVAKEVRLKISTLIASN